MSPSSGAGRLLVATDGSPPARLATVVGARMATAKDADLTVLHVAAPTPYRIARMAVPVAVTCRLDDPLRNAVLNDARRLVFEEGAACTPVMLTGDPPAAVVAFARRQDTELLVIGAHHHAWFAICRARTAAESRAMRRAPSSSCRLPGPIGARFRASFGRCRCPASSWPSPRPDVPTAAISDWTAAAPMTSGGSAASSPFP